MKQDIGKKIKYYRKKLGISQEALAYKADIHPAYVGRLERNEKNPTIETLDRIINALGISYSEFFSDISDDDNAEKRFYIDRVINILSSLPCEKYC